MMASVLIVPPMVPSTTRVGVEVSEDAPTSPKSSEGHVGTITRKCPTLARRARKGNNDLPSAPPTPPYSPIIRIAPGPMVMAFLPWRLLAIASWSALPSSSAGVLPSHGKVASPPEMVSVPGAQFSSLGN